jgi:hypothetical protein
MYKNGFALNPVLFPISPTTGAQKATPILYTGYQAASIVQ